MNAIVIYWSRTGNTKQAAHAIRDGLSAGGADVSLTTVDEAGDLDYFDYALVCLGFPSYGWSPPDPVLKWLKGKHRMYGQQGRVQVGASEVAGTQALVFVTYSGPHTGINEAIPAGKTAGQFFEHLGIRVLDEWYIVGEFHGNEEASIKGRLGDIRGRPTEDDLRGIRERATTLVRRL
ncbi:MAG: flavodoxin domain-containing protein [Anaerolineae bacterium]|nr:flavodoxin domain-containing protein [Anaerolineae bacterium]